MFLAIVFITLGLAFLALNVGLISLVTFRVLWPLLLVFFGVYLLMTGKDSWKDFGFGKKKKKSK